MPVHPDSVANECDDAFAFFSNYGPSVDVTAPGVNVYSTWAGGGYSRRAAPAWRRRTSQASRPS